MKKVILTVFVLCIIIIFSFQPVFAETTEENKDWADVKGNLDDFMGSLGDFSLYLITPAIFTPFLVVGVSCCLVAIMTTPSTDVAYRYKQYIKWMVEAWLILAIVPDIFVVLFEFAKGSGLGW